MNKKCFFSVASKVNLSWATRQGEDKVACGGVDLFAFAPIIVLFICSLFASLALHPSKRPMNGRLQLAAAVVLSCSVFSCAGLPFPVDLFACDKTKSAIPDSGLPDSAARLLLFAFILLLLFLCSLICYVYSWLLIR